MTGLAILRPMLIFLSGSLDGWTDSWLDGWIDWSIHHLFYSTTVMTITIRSSLPVSCGSTAVTGVDIHGTSIGPRCTHNGALLYMYLQRWRCFLSNSWPGTWCIVVLCFPRPLLPRLLRFQAWLGKFLSTYQGTLVTVSHDEALLEGVKLSTVAEVANQRVEVFKGCGFKKFLFERDERMKWDCVRYLHTHSHRQRRSGYPRACDCCYCSWLCQCPRNNVRRSRTNYLYLVFNQVTRS